MIGAVLCRLGIHRWRDCKRAVWDMEHSRMSLDLCACARCGKVRDVDDDQLYYIWRTTKVPFRIEDVARG